MTRTYQYFPGCSLKGTGRAYEESLLAVMKVLGVELKEIDDWNCCGATAYMSVDEAKAFALCGRNLALAEQQEGDVVTPCNACYLVLNKAQNYLREYPHLLETVQGALKTINLEYRGTKVVRHPLDILINDVGLEAIRQKVVRPLRGVRVAPYYGCLLVRPNATFDDQYNPVVMDKLLKTCGMEVVDWPLKTHCCGGSETGTLPEVGLRLVFNLLKEAVRRGADVIATICPLCQFNLEAYRDNIARRFENISLPSVFFTQIMGLAMGLSPREVSLNRLLVSAEPVLARMEVHHV